MKLAIGTAQFGLPYGVSNSKGQLTEKEATNILVLCSLSGIDMLDTAAGYGNSEEIIGRILRKNRLNFKIITKLPADITSNHIFDAVQASLLKFNLQKVYAVLVHKFSALQNDKEYWGKLHETKRNGLTEKIGVSVYFPSEIEWLFENKIDVDIIQLPYNVLDNRFEFLFQELKKRNIEVHARSVFLQGLLFIPSEKLPPYFESIKPLISRLHGLSEEAKITLNTLLLGYLYVNSAVDKIVIGVESLENLRENIDAIGKIDTVRKVYDHLRNFRIEDETILLPFNWKLT